jgi:WD40 repeat protein
VKTDSAGNMQWSNTYEQSSIHCVVAVPDGGYILTGAWNYSGNCDCWLAKTDSKGVMEWNRTYEGPANDYACSVVASPDGGYAVAGATNGDFWLVKTNAEGDMEWSQTYGGLGADVACSLVATSDGGYAVAGVWGCDIGLWDLRGFSSGGDAWLVKTDASGNLEWNQTYGGPGADWAASLIETSDGGYAIAGTFNCTEFIVGGGGDYWLVKTDALGNMQWSRTYGGEGAEATSCLIEAPDGGYVIAGSGPSSDHESFDFWLVKTDESGFSAEVSSWSPLLTLLLIGA